MKKAEMLGVWFILQEEVKNQRIREENQQTVPFVFEGSHSLIGHALFVNIIPKHL